MQHSQHLKVERVVFNALKMKLPRSAATRRVPSKRLPSFPSLNHAA